MKFIFRLSPYLRLGFQLLLLAVVGKQMVLLPTKRPELHRMPAPSLALQLTCRQFIICPHHKKGEDGTVRHQEIDHIDISLIRVYYYSCPILPL